jgi:hypothetical protein
MTCLLRAEAVPSLKIPRKESRMNLGGHMPATHVHRFLFGLELLWVVSL